MPAEFIMKRRVQFAEIDIAGVLHFSNYYRIMEEAEHAFLRTLDINVIHPDGDRVISWPRIATNCEYLAPALFEDELDIALSITKITDRTITYTAEFRKDDQRIAIGSMTAVCCAMENSTFQSIPIPDFLLEKLNGAGAPASR